MSTVQLPKQRVRVPMPVLSPMTTPEGTVSVPWMYYLMPRDAWLFDQLGWVVATCDPLAAGEDISIHQPIGLPGRIGFVEAVAKDPPDASGSDAVLDIQKSSDGGDTWGSIFQAGDENKMPLARGSGSVSFQWGTFDEDAAQCRTGDKLRLDCVQPGTGTQWVTVKLYILLDPIDSTSAMTPGGPGSGGGGGAGGGGSAGGGGGSAEVYDFPEALL